MVARAASALCVAMCVLAAVPVALAAKPAPAMVGGAGTDDDGYPRATADRRAALRLLRARQFDQLDDWLVDLQAQFEADYRKEYWPRDALEALGNADPTLESLLDAWVAAKPDSYMALAARGIYQNEIGWKRRGGKWAHLTPSKNFAGMRAAHTVAFPDLDEALARHPALVTAHLALINIANANGAPTRVIRRILDQALAACPDCYAVRLAFIGALSPRWGGSYEAMRAFAEESALASTNPKVRLLAGAVDEDQCDVLFRAQRTAEALRACDAALALGDAVDPLEQRAWVLRKTNPGAALADLNRALALRPQKPQLIARRAGLLATLRDYEGHARDIALLKEIDPVGRVAARDLSWAAQGLAAEAGRKRQAGQGDDEIALLERAVSLDPDQIDNYLRLDAALMRVRQLDRIPPIWRRYLARHPRDARAHLEQAGALHHLGREAEALQEATAACQLGEPTGCAIAARRAR